MKIFIIILIIIVVIIFLFQKDKRKAIRSNIIRGGLKNLFPNFVDFCERVYEDYGENGEMKMQLARDDESYLEYKVPIFRGKIAIAHIYYGIENSIGTYAYCYVISNNGYKHSGYIREINKNNSINIYDPNYGEYFEIFERLFTKIVNSNDFYKLGINRMP
jgi:hypothetical protein